MITQIAETVLDLWKTGRKTKSTVSGWLSGNAVCCSHRGESADTRSRGGIIASANGAITYRCFNCNFKTSYAPGRPLTYKFRKFLKWLNADENTIERLSIEALRIKDLVPTIETAPEETTNDVVTFTPRQLPEGAVNFQGLAEFYQLSNQQIPADFIDTVDYIANRAVDLQKYDFYWTPDEIYGLNRRAIIPFTWCGQLVGYTARTIDTTAKPKYHSSQDPHFVFNVDKQPHTAKFVIVCEGPFDAISVNGVAVLSNDISEQQADIIDNLGREVIVVPDFDVKVDEKTGKKRWSGAQLITRAVEYGWTVSFPVWHETCKDINEAVVKYGKLFVIKAILDARETSKLKIELFRKKLYNKL